ncbi:hypothetical protein COV93_03590, partial [Candidatus Woesearchaeota archaeon CG11_big_fil_rev_8_21_14_0_20_43_8]
MGENEKKKEDFYIRIGDPLEMRRNILESSRSIVRCMQSYQKVSALRERKTDSVLKLRSLMKETGLLMNKLKNILPKHKFTPLPGKFVSAVRTPTEDEVNALESELDQIENV